MVKRCANSDPTTLGYVEPRGVMPATESEKLIGELESIYRIDGWRNDAKQVLHVAKVRMRLGVLLGRDA